MWPGVRRRSTPRVVSRSTTDHSVRPPDHDAGARGHAPRRAVALRARAARMRTPSRRAAGRAGVRDRRAGRVRARPDFAVERGAHRGGRAPRRPDRAAVRPCSALTGWERYPSDAERYVDGRRCSGMLEVGAAELPLERGRSSVIGIDTLGVDPGAATDCPVHHADPARRPIGTSTGLVDLAALAAARRAARGRRAATRRRLRQRRRGVLRYFRTRGVGLAATPASCRRRRPRAARRPCRSSPT